MTDTHPAAAGRFATERPSADRPAIGRPGDVVREIYEAGVAGHRPHLPTDLTALAEPARRMMTQAGFGYLAGNAGVGEAGDANRAAFARWRLVPRILRGTRQPDLAVSLFGHRLATPVLLAPIAAQTLAHPDGELAAARAAADVGVPVVLSCNASYPMEEVAAAAGPGPRWFQFYWPTDQAVGDSLVRRAEASGYSALVFTVDASFGSYRPIDLDHGYLPFLHGAGRGNYTSDPVFQAGLPHGADEATVREHWRRVTANPALTWEHLPRLRAATRLPILVKGVMHPDDARRARDAGADGLIVSNHGGRQLDGSAAALDVLPAVRAAVGPDLPVLMDSGIRSGVDVVKALALGADAVLYGRPYVYGLALQGEQGVRHVLRCLLAELESTLALIGCAAVADVTADLIVPPGPLPVEPARLPAQGGGRKG